MYRPLKGSGSRGSSILGSILLLALAGSTASIIEPPFPFDSISQLAASPLALESTASVQSTPQPELKPGEEVKDDLGTQTVQSGFTTYNVHWACMQAGTLEDVKKLTQNCSPGFEYTVLVDADKRQITVTPRALASCPAGVGSEKVCSSGKAALKSCVTGAGQNMSCSIKTEAANMSGNECSQVVGAGQAWSVESTIATNVQCRLDKESDFASSPAEAEEAQRNIMNEFGYSLPQQNAILNAFKEETVKEGAVNDLQAQENEVTRKLAALAECTTCAAEKATLETQKRNIASRLQATQAELDGLRNNQQRLLAGEPPSSIPPTPLVPGPDISSRLDFARNTTGFNGTDIKPETETTRAFVVAEPPKTPNPTGEIDWGKFYSQGSSYRPTPQTPGQVAETPISRPSVSISDLVREAEEPNRLYGENLTQFPEEYRDIAQKQCELGRCSLMHRIAGDDSTTAQEKAGQVTQVALIGSPSCSNVSIADCFKAADLPYTLDGRKQVCGALGLDYCDSVGSAKTNVRMAEDVKRFSQTGTVTEITQTRTLSIDSRGSILEEEITEKSTESQIIAPSYKEGATLRDLEAFYDRAQETKNGVETVYKVTGDICGVVGSESGDQSCSYYRRLADAQGGVLSKDQLPSYTRQQLTAVEAAGKAIQTPFPAPSAIAGSGDTTPAPRTTVSNNNLGPIPLDLSEVESALVAYDEKVARGQTLTAAESAIQTYDERVARERATQAESQRLQGLANYLNQKSYIKNSDTTKNMYNTMVELGRTPEEASQFVNEFADDGAWENWRAGQPITIKDANGKDTPGPGLVAANTYLSSGTDRMIDSHIETTVEATRANIQRQITAAEQYLALKDEGIELTAEGLAQDFVSDSQARLEKLNRDYESYLAGNPTPEYQQAIDRIKEGDVSGGTLWSALEGVTERMDSDRTGIENSLSANREDPLASITLGTAWLTNQAIGGSADGTKNILSRLGVPGFQSNAQSQLLDAIDPLGVELRTVGDVAGAVPLNLGTGSLITRAGRAGLDAYVGPVSRGAAPTFSGIAPRIEPTLGAPPVQSPVAPFSNPSSFNVDGWMRAFESDLDASRIEGAATAIQTPLAPPSSFTQIPPWTRVQPNDIQLPASPSTSGLPPLDTSKIRTIFNLPPSAPAASAPVSNAPVLVSFMRRGQLVTQWRDPITKQFTQAPVSAPTVNFSSIRIVPPAPMSTPLPTLNASPLSPDAVNRIRTTFGLPTLQ